MPLVEFNWKPTDRQLRQFGAACAIALPLIAWFWSAPSKIVGILAAVGVLVAIIGWFRPPLVKPIFLALALVATPFGMVIGELMILLIYWIVFVPMGLCFRLMGRDTLQRQAKPQDTYWEPFKQPNGVASYYRQS